MGFRAQLPDCVAFVVWDAGVSATDLDDLHGDSSVYTWASFLALSSGRPSFDLLAAVSARSEAVEPGHCATLIYTSGTTGNPKAVMVSNDNIIFTSVSGAFGLYKILLL